MKTKPEPCGTSPEPAWNQALFRTPACWFHPMILNAKAILHIGRAAD